MKYEDKERILRDQLYLARDSLFNTRKDHPLKQEYRNAWIKARYELKRFQQSSNGNKQNKEYEND